MLKQTNLDKLFRTAPLITSAKNVQSEDMLNDQMFLSNNEHVNKYLRKEKKALTDENQAEVIINLSDRNETRTLSNISVDHNYDYHIQTVNNEVTVTSTTPVTISKKKGGRYLATWEQQPESFL